MFSYEYPFWLADGKYPYTKIGRRNAVIYWGNEFSHGQNETIPFGDSEELIFDYGVKQEDPQSYTKATNVYTEIVLGWGAFRFTNFALDISRGKIEISEILPRVGFKVPYHKHDPGNILVTIPNIEAEVGGRKYLFQVDIGDRYTSVPKEMVAGLTPIRTEMLVPYGSFRRRRKVDVYSLPIKLSDDVEIQAEAVVITDTEQAGFTYTGTNGCIGVDLIRNHRVTFTPEIEDDDVPAMYFKPFVK